MAIANPEAYRQDENEPVREKEVEEKILLEISASATLPLPNHE